MTTRSLLFFLLLGSLSAVTGCSHDTNEPTAGTLKANLASPNTDDGAVLFTVSGGSVDSVAASDHQVYSARLDANTLRVVVIGDVGSGTLATIYLGDIRLASSYSATVNQVAARVSYAQRDPASYSVSLSP
jgi:hypothetical protein